MERGTRGQQLPELRFRGVLLARSMVSQSGELGKLARRGRFRAERWTALSSPPFYPLVTAGHPIARGIGSSHATFAVTLETDWTALGHRRIDQEHKALARIVRDLESIVGCGAESEVSALLEQLVSYSTFHFQSEETAMRAARFPDIDEHADQHKEFTAKVTLLQLQPYRTDRGPELLGFVQQWFLTHTMGTDEKFAEFLRKRAA